MDGRTDACTIRLSERVSSKNRKRKKIDSSGVAPRVRLALYYDLKVLIDAFRSSTDGLKANRVRAITILHYMYATLGRLTMTVAYDTGSLLLLNNRLWTEAVRFCFYTFLKNRKQRTLLVHCNT